MDTMMFVIAGLVLLSVVMLITGMAGAGKARMEDRLDQYRMDREVQPGAGVDRPRLRQRSYSGLPVLSVFLSQFKGSEQVAIFLEKAGVPLRVGEYYMIRYAMGGLFAVIPFIFSQTLFSVFIAFILAVAGYMLPAMYIGSKKRARTTRINAQLVEMLGLVANSLKSGYGLMQSFEFAARQIQPPLALELRRMLREANLGLSAEDSLNALGERIESPDLDMVLTAINIQRAVGGNLAEILEKVAFTMRERERIRGEVKTLTAQQSMTGVIIGGLPIGMALLFMMINPAYMGLLFTETAGRIMLVMAIGFEVMGVLTMKKILAIEV